MNEYETFAKFVNPQYTGESIKKTLLTITKKEIKVIKLYFGLESEKKNMKDIATELGITENKVKELLAVAIRKLRHPARIKNATAE